ncbi:hypothetical protein DWB77_07329 [Streptomyces hundungensis]|uniref:Putative sensor domain-containing protein n=1 Tax=Streptomyces hundungensis TaxID=1077946 RepID=A0A387HQP5_9ACTN|nr:sensor domain-containing protein [Streptomyces hundungensis]AYG85113.1 hypothetical protein DWB77_07329 [Streptomyces hundungensis]
MDITQPPLARSGRPTGRIAAILRAPFRALTWRRFAYIVLALPVGILCIPLALLGGQAGHIQRALAQRLLGVEVEAPERNGPLTLVHAVISAPLNLVAAISSGLFWFVVAINLGYPLRPDNDTSDSWGGPTMAGAWAVHATGGLGFLLVAPWVIKGFTTLQGRLVRGFLGADRRGLLKTTSLALTVAALCCLLSIPLIHQAQG